MTAQFNSGVWNKTSPSRQDITVDRSPDDSDYDQTQKEIVAMQQAVYNPETNFNWVSLADTLANSWTAVSGKAPSYRKIGAWIWIRGAITAGTKTDGTTCLVLPAGARPPHAMTFSVCPDATGTGDANMRVLIGTDGTVKVYGLTNTTNISLAGINFATA